MKHLHYIFLLFLTITSCKPQEARKPESVQSGSFIKQSAERNKKLIAKERTKIEAIITKDTTAKFIASENGFWYAYQNKVEQDTITPDFGDSINFDYNIQDLDGQIIYSKSQIGNKDYVMEKEILFSGLREGLKLMKPSERVTFIFPSQVAYGYYGDDNKIGTNVPIICDVTLNSITQNSND